MSGLSESERAEYLELEEKRNQALNDLDLPAAYEAVKRMKELMPPGPVVPEGIAELVEGGVVLNNGEFVSDLDADLYCTACGTGRNSDGTCPKCAP